jgi:3-oxoacyl-(acyl-carrier-protein) synthase
MLALRMAEDLMNNPELDRCLVVGAEEADWLLCDAYRKWRLLRAAPPIEPFAKTPHGMILSEGAGAVLLAREGGPILEHVHAGGNFSRRAELVRQLAQIISDVNDQGQASAWIASANGTFIDAAERATACKHFPNAAAYTPKPALGESVAAGAFWQLICAAQALRTQMLPPVLHTMESPELAIAREARDEQWRRVLITTCGLSQQVGACVISR